MKDNQSFDPGFYHNDEGQYVPTCRSQLETLIWQRDVPLSKIDVHQVKDFSNLFAGCTKLNNLRGIENWDMSNAEDLHGMFCNSPLTIPNLKNWDVCHVKDMTRMFEGTKDFNQDLNDWIIRGSCRTVDMFKDSKMEFNNIQYALSLSQLRSASQEFEENLNLEHRDIRNLSDYGLGQGYVLVTYTGEELLGAKNHSEVIDDLIMSCDSRIKQFDTFDEAFDYSQKLDLAHYQQHQQKSTLTRGR